MNFHSIDGILRILHVSAGAIALLTGLLAIVTRKGKKAHNLVGMTYFGAMTAIFITAIPIAIPKTNIFLLAVSVFSFYLAYTGFRYTRLKKIKHTPIFDLVFSYIAAVVFLAMIVMGSWLLLIGQPVIATLLLVFGGIGLSMAIRDILRLSGKTKELPGNWIPGHLIRMQGSYIAAVTAFLVNNFRDLPPLVLWLGPTLIGTAGIFISANHYQKKFKVGKYARKKAE